MIKRRAQRVDVAAGVGGLGVHGLLVGHVERRAECTHGVGKERRRTHFVRRRVRGRSEVIDVEQDLHVIFRPVALRDPEVRVEDRIPDLRFVRAVDVRGPERVRGGETAVRVVRTVWSEARRRGR